MKTASPIRAGLAGTICVGVCLLAAWRGQAIQSSGAWYSIVPPLLSVSLALLTRRLMFSLSLGVLAGGLLSTAVAAPHSPAAWARGLLAGPGFALTVLREPTNLQILAFVALVLMMIAVLIVAGGLQGIVDWLARFARGPRSTQLLTALMGLVVFIDDYANTMIVGSSMRPMADRHRVSREKLAFLVDATSAPVTGIAVVSTWIGYEAGLFGEISASLGFGKSGYGVFFDALAFRFYCFLMIAFVLLNTLTGRDYGPMLRAERRARTTGQLSAPDARPMTSRAFASAQPAAGARVRALTAIVPLAGLFAFLIAALWIDGGGAELLRTGARHLLSPSAWREVIGSAEHNILILALAGALGVLLAIVCAVAIGRLGARPLGRTLLAGLRGSLLPMAILTLAWSLKTACDTLGTGAFLVDAVGGLLSPVWFPVLIFLLACLISFATGTSWGTMAILIPTAGPLAFELDGGRYGLTTMMSLGAVLDGAIFGDHCSPISDTTIMSSISSACDHVHHVTTQLPYSVTVAAFAAGAGYLPAAMGLPSGLCLLLGTAGMAGLFLLLRQRQGLSPASGARSEVRA
ncbi:MAG: Na+/H+ antiporter NhaC family protein [Candidatus Eisenbacteria bacterium]